MKGAATVGRWRRGHWRYWAVIGLVLALVAAKWQPETGFTALLRFGEPWHERRLETLQSLPVAVTPGSHGYDGQFYAQIATDPALRSPELERALDNPAYRSRRIGLPWLAALLGAGNTWWTLNVFALLNVAFWLALAALLYREIGDATTSGFARWAGCVLALGTLESVRLSLVDLPALVLLVVAVRACRTGAARSSLLAAAAAVLTKETTLLGVAAGRTWRGGAGQWRRNAITLLAVAAPLALWLGFVQARFGPAAETGWRGNLTLPGAAMVTQVSEWIAACWRLEASDRVLFGLLGTFAAGVQVTVLATTVKERSSAWWRIGMAYSVLLFLLGPLVWQGHWAVARAILPLTVAFNLLLPAGPRFWLVWTLGNLAAVHGLVRFL